MATTLYRVKDQDIKLTAGIGKRIELKDNLTETKNRLEESLKSMEQHFQRNYKKY